VCFCPVRGGGGGLRDPAVVMLPLVAASLCPKHIQHDIAASASVSNPKECSSMTVVAAHVSPYYVAPLLEMFHMCGHAMYA